MTLGRSVLHAVSKADGNDVDRIEGRVLFGARGCSFYGRQAGPGPLLLAVRSDELP